MSGRRIVAGSALVAALWSVAIMTALALALADEARAARHLARAQGDYAEARAAASSAVHRALAGLVGYRTGGKPREVQRGAAKVTVTVRSEATKPDLNTTLARSLPALLVPVVGPQRARLVAARILDWRDGDSSPRTGGAEEAQYDVAGRADGPRDGPFLHEIEVHQVLGVVPREADAIARSFTVHGQTREPASDDAEWAMRGGAFEIDVQASVGRATVHALVKARLGGGRRSRPAILAWHWERAEP